MAERIIAFPAKPPDTRRRKRLWVSCLLLLCLLFIPASACMAEAGIDQAELLQIALDGMDRTDAAGIAWEAVRRAFTAEGERDYLAVQMAVTYPAAWLEPVLEVRFLEGDRLLYCVGLLIGLFDPVYVIKL